MDAPGTSKRYGSVPAVVTVGAALALVGRWFWIVKDLGYLGWDSFPILITSRVASWSDLIAVLTGRLMPEFYPGAFHRPVMSLTVAAELGLGGPNPVASALVQVALLALCALFFHRLQLKLMPTSPWIASAGTILMLLHPATGGVLPYLARRPDLLSSLFLVWMLDLEASSDRPSWHRRGIGVLLALCAMGSKETGLMAPLLVAVLAIVLASGDWRDRLREAARRSAIYGGAAVVYLLGRVAVLGGLGGHNQAGSPALFPGHFLELVGGLASARTGSLVPTLLLGLCVAVFAVLTTRPTERSPGIDEREGFGVAISLATGWLAALALVLTAAGRFSTWYVFAGVMPFCLLVSAAVGLTIRSLRRSAGARIPAAASLVLWLMVIATALRYSPVLTTNPEWERARAEAAAFYARLGPILRTAQAGDMIRAGSYPAVVRPADPHLRQRHIAVLAPYSIEAWVMFQRPDLEIRVGKPRDLRSAPPRARELAIEVRRGAKVTVGDDGEPDAAVDSPQFR